MSALALQALLISVTLAQGAPAQDARGPVGDHLKPRESIGSLLSGSLRDEPAREASGMLLRLLGWVAALAVAALLTARIWRRLSSQGRVGSPGGGLKVVSRAALTPRHSIYAVRVGSRRLLLVGVSGDRMTPLGEIDDPPEARALDPAFAETLEKALHEREARGGPPAEGPANGEAGAGGSGYPAQPEEVRRLRTTVHRWKGLLGRPIGS